jgi:penicillin-binding protein 2
MVKRFDSNWNSQTFKRRLFAVTTVVVVSFFLLTAYLFFLQVINSPVYKRRAREVARRSFDIHARRGEIFDRNSDVSLITNIDSFALDLIPGEVPEGEMEGIFEKLSGLFPDVEAEEIQAKIKKRYYRHFQPFEIKSGVSKETIYYLAEHIQDYPGVAWHSKPKRSYSFQGSLSHILGYVDTITTEEMQLLYNKGYSFDAVIGKSGIEKYYDEILRGKDGKRFEIVDVKGKQTSQQADKQIPPEPGKNLVLTVDRNIQQLCEKALGKRNGSVVVLKPTTGEILALVSYPWFDPNIFTKEANPSEYREIALNPESPFLNRGIQSVYPPASVFKIVLTAAIVEDEVFSETETVDCNGKMYFGDREWNCWRETGHGPVDLKLGLAKSCDIYFWTAGLRLGVERIVRFAREFGLGRLTGIDLPEEVQGFLATPEWKEQKHHMPWLGGDTLNMSIGQGWTLVTPLQIANMVAMVVNEGIVYKPHLVKEIRDPETGGILSLIEREVLYQSYISSETFKFLKEAMRLVITEGTARYVITTPVVEVAGKTGTGEIGLEDIYHSWFTAFAPYETDNPDERIVLVVMVEAKPDDENGYEWWSPKAGNAILQGIFAHQSYEEVVEALNLWYLKENSNLE